MRETSFVVEIYFLFIYPDDAERSEELLFYFKIYASLVARRLDCTGRCWSSLLQGLSDSRLG